MAQDAGVPADSIVLAENGSVVELSESGVGIVDRIDAGITFVDGLAVGDISDVALRDRKRLSEDGVLIVVATLASANGRRTATPELIARGIPDSEDFVDELRVEATRVLNELIEENILEIKLLQEHLHDDLGRFVYAKTRKRPLILPVVVEV
jgi:ribonuclease J